MRYSCRYKKILSAALWLLQTGFLLGQEGYVKGKITNGNENLASASISLGNTTKLTDVSGLFEFSLPAGKYNLIITHIGYSKIEETIIVQAGKTKNLNYLLAPLEQMGDEVVLQSLSGIKRSNLNTPVLVEVISSKTLLQTGQPSLVQMLGATVPSLNISRQQVWDPLTFRGLNPDHLLLLVDGVRYHPRSSITALQGSGGQLGKGSVVNDFYGIPFSAIEKIEILYDGASAQFGSDAIAAVVNIHLKKAIGKTFIQLNAGQYYKNDGGTINIGINHGAAIFKKGFINLSADVHSRDRTYRGNIYPGTVYYPIPKDASNHQEDSITAMDNRKIAERGFDRTRIPPGYESQKLYGIGFLVNGGIPLKKNTELFWTGIANHRDPSYPMSFRLPKNETQINAEMYPDGFLPETNAPVWDFSLKAGARGKTMNKWNWNFTSGYGKNKITLETHNNNNASQQFLMGKNAQTDFRCGGTSFSQFINNINFTKRISTLISKLKSMNIALGSEWRLDNYQEEPGEEASRKNYDNSGRKQGGVQGVFVSLDSNDVSVSRNVIAMYADIETEINGQLLVDIAVRPEYYSDYGASLAGKLAARYKFSDRFLLRGSMSNNFRAPPLQQAYYSAAVNAKDTRIDASGQRHPGTVGIFRNDHDVIRQGFGVPKLKPEKAINISAGITSNISSFFSITVDAYWIQLKDRIVFSGRFDTTNTDVKKILAQFPKISAVHFACNAVNTRTVGGDILLNSRWNFLKGQLGFTFAVNLNRTRLFGIAQTAANLPTDSASTNTLFNRGEIGRAERAQPSSKIILTTFYKKGVWSITMINKRFGSTEFIHDSLSTLDELFSAKIITDLNIKFSPKTWYSLTIGANNLFNVTPDRVKNPENNNDGRQPYGSQYIPFSPNGGYYFVSMSFNW